MDVFERIKILSQKRDISMKEVALELGFSENLFYKWKTSNPKATDLAKVADYFHVTVDYLLGRDEDGILPESDWLEMLKSQENFSGSPTSEKDKEILKNVVLNYLKGQMKDKK